MYKYITNAIMSGLFLIGFVMYIISINISIDVVGHYYGGVFKPDYIPSIWKEPKLLFGAVGIVLLSVAWLVSLIIGIITLVTIGSPINKNLIIFSAILGIIGGLFGVNVIVSSIIIKKNLNF